MRTAFAHVLDSPADRVGELAALWAARRRRPAESLRREAARSLDLGTTTLSECRVMAMLSQAALARMMTANTPGVRFRLVRGQEAVAGAESDSTPSATFVRFPATSRYREPVLQ